MAVKTYTMGLQKIEVAAYPTSGSEAGGMATTSFEQLGLTNEGSCKLSIPKSEAQDFFAEEKSGAVFSIPKGVIPTLVFSIMNPDLSTFAKMWGGTVKKGSPSQGTRTDTWDMPNITTLPEFSVKVTTKEGICFSIPRMRMAPSTEGTIGKTGLYMIDIEGTCMEPEKEGVAMITLNHTVADPSK